MKTNSKRWRRAIIRTYRGKDYGEVLRRHYTIKAFMWICRNAKRVTFTLLMLFSINAQGNLLDAIAMVESGAQDSYVGAAGEKSRYQIKPAVWHQYSNSTAYTNPAVSRRVAATHLTWLRSSYRRITGFEPSNRDLAVMWQTGLKGFQKRRFDFTRLSRRERDRATRIMNLMEIEQ